MYVRRLTGHDCVICGDAIRGTEIRAPCSHYYDKSCIIELFKAATRDETLYPPRCCRQQIPLSSVRSLLTADAIELFNEKAAEFRTLNRVYCSNPRCSRFLGPQQEGPKPSAYHLFKCSAPDCKTETCACCKARVESHTKSSHVCRKDVDAHDVLALGERARWARCPGCEALIELNLGCFHMTCRCKTEFCYSCGARWKTCRCPQWEERRLLAAAEARVDIRLGLPPVRRGEGIRGRATAPRHVLFRVPRPVLRLPREEIEDEHPTTRNIQQEQTLSTHEPEPVPANLPHNTDQSRQSSGHVGDDVAFTATAKQRQNTKLFAPSRRKHSPPHVDIESWRRQLPVASSSKLPASSLAGPIKSLNWKKQEQSVASATTSHYREAKGSAVEDVWKEIEELIERPPTAWKHDIDTWRADVRRASTASTTSDIIVNPNGKGKEPETRTRWQLVREAMEHLRGHHECDHAHWSYRKGSGTCDTCHYHLPFYLYVSIPILLWRVSDLKAEKEFPAMHRLRYVGVQKVQAESSLEYFPSSTSRATIMTLVPMSSFLSASTICPLYNATIHTSIFATSCTRMSHGMTCHFPQTSSQCLKEGM